MTATLRVVLALFGLIAGAVDACDLASAAGSQRLPGTRVTVDLPSGSVVSRGSDRLKFVVQPLGIKIWIREGGPELYNSERRTLKYSARAFRRGKLPRSDTYLYLWWPGSAVDKIGHRNERGSSSEFHLVLSEPDQVTAIVVDVPPPAFDADELKVQDIEDLLASVRVVPAAPGTQ